VDAQAMARVHRLGQTKPVHIYRLVTQGTVEERMIQRAEKKLYLDQMVNRGSTAMAEILDKTVTDRGELLSLLRFGADAVFQVNCGPWRVNYVWFMACGLWSMVCELWSMACELWPLACK
jgi:SWI/SNF-related matrix-associated actin-dependent regulator of chromatin subfamily A member 5